MWYAFGMKSAAVICHCRMCVQNGKVIGNWTHREMCCVIPFLWATNVPSIAINSQKGEVNSWNVIGKIGF